MSSGMHAALHGSRQRKDRFGQPVPPGAKLKAVGRILTCHACHTPVDVLEARTGAQTLGEHRWINPDVYRCGDCQSPVPLPERNHDRPPR